MPTFSQETPLNASCEDVWKWHQAPLAFKRFIPYWEKIKIISLGKLENNHETSFKISLGPMYLRWKALISNVINQKSFIDSMTQGPFKKWQHTHTFIPLNTEKTIMRDEIEWELPFHSILKIVAPFFVIPKLKKTFSFRAKRIQNDLNAIKQFSHIKRKRILISGSTGLIGSQLTSYLSCAGHNVYTLQREKGKRNPLFSQDHTVVWNDETGDVIYGNLEGFDCIIHLAGASIADKRWNPARKEEIRLTRVTPTKHLSHHISQLKNPPESFLSSSAIGFYGNRGLEILTENSTQGTGFLSQTCLEWENATSIASEKGIRTILLRTGIVLDPQGGALKKLLLPTLLGVSGPVGSGQQIQSWISIEDYIYALDYLMMNETTYGPFNLTAPQPLSQKEFAQTLARLLKRPCYAPLPEFMVSLLFGEMGQRLILEGQHVLPQKLLSSGFEFKYPDLTSALKHLLGL